MGNDREYDVVVIGAGPNGLAAAALLARRGRKVLVAEARPYAGGLAACEEFSPGYRASGVIHDTTTWRHGLTAALDLGKHGLELAAAPPPVFAPQRDGRGLRLHDDADRAGEEIAAFSDRDAEAYREFRAFIGRVRGTVNHLMDAPPMELSRPRSSAELWRLLNSGLALRRLGRHDLAELMRVSPMCVADWLDEWFETDLLKAALAGPALYGNFTGPRSPGTAASLLLWLCRRGPAVRGGSAALVAALEACARAQGADVRFNAPVARILVSAGRVTGVELDGGETLNARAVAASCDPKQALLELVAAGDIPETFARHLAHYRTAGTTAKVDIGLKRPFETAGRPGERFECVRTGERLDELERAFDAVKYGDYSEWPVLDVHVSTVPQPDFAPDGHDVLSVGVHFAPYHRRSGWTEAAREALGDRVVETLVAFAPAIRDAVACRRVMSPTDIETHYRVTGGHIHHGDHMLDQMIVRPAPGCAAYATPIDGLFLCGGGSHPGGGLTGAPGALAARVISRNL